MAHCSAYLVPCALFFVGVVAIMLLTIRTEETYGVPDYMYGIVVDAGSSHTAVYIYKWPADKQNGTGVVTQHQECHVKGGGISSYVGKSGGAGLSLEACLDKAVKDIPKARHHLTPIYLGATAGMRLLDLWNPEASSQILEEVGQKIQSYPFNYNGAAILSGREEGAYGWVTVNYLLENLIKYGFVGRWLSPNRPTVGALDLGGASTQITFVTEERVEDAGDVMQLRLYGRVYTLYTHSYLCYGRDQALKKLLAHIVKSYDHHSGVVSHPCYPVGYEVTLKMDQLFDTPCTSDSRPDPYRPAEEVLVRGTGRYDQCLANISHIFSFGQCPFSQCSFNKVFQPNVTGNFMAFSAFYYTHAFLEKVVGIHVSNPLELEEASRAVCEMTYDELKRRAPEQKVRLQQYCATTNFLQVLMMRGYGFDRRSFPHISFQKKAADTSVGWALGYMLSLSSLLPAEGAPVMKSLTHGAWVALLSLFILVLLLALVFTLLKAKAMLGKKKCGGETNI